MQINAYLHFNGDCEEAFNFYAQVLGGTIEAMFRHEGMPAAEHTPPEWLQKIMHARLRVGDQVLMGSDAPPGYFKPPQGFTVSLGYSDVADGQRVFQALAAGGNPHMPFQATFWAKGFGMVVDRFGMPWMVNCE